MKLSGPVICYCRPDRQCGHCAYSAVIAETLAIPVSKLRLDDQANAENGRAGARKRHDAA